MEVRDGNMETGTLAKSLKQCGTVALNQCSQQLPGVFIGELVTNRKSCYLFSRIDGIQVSGLIDVGDVKMIIYHYSSEMLPVGFPVCSAGESLFSVTALPSSSNGWCNLAFDGNLQYHLLGSLLSSMRLFSGRVSRAVVATPQYIAQLCAFRMVLLSGPPGTGKTSLCSALAEKLAIRLGKRAFYLQVSCQTLLSKWYSESGKLIKKLFEDVRLICSEYATSLAIVAFDEIESIVVSRESSFSSNEPTDSIRVLFTNS